MHGENKKENLETDKNILLLSHGTAIILLILYVLIVVIANRRSTPVNFVFFTTEASLFVILLLAIALGFVAGWLFDDLRERRRRKRDD